MLNGIKSGKSFAEALAETIPKLFTSVYTNMVRAGRKVEYYHRYLKAGNISRTLTKSRGEIIDVLLFISRHRLKWFSVSAGRTKHNP